MTEPPKPPEVLNRIVRTVLSYHPKPKSEPAKKRQRLARAARRAGQPARQRPDGTREERARQTALAIDQAVTAERERIAERVSERRILRLQVGRDPVEQANEIIQDLAYDIETNWADYDDEDD